MYSNSVMALHFPSHMGVLLPTPTLPLRSDAQGLDTILLAVPNCSSLPGPFCDCHPKSCSCAICGTCHNCLSCVICDGPIPPPPPPLPPPPASWRLKQQHAQMLVTSVEPDDGFFPSIGNGFISGDVGCYRGVQKSGPQHMQKGSCGLMHIGGVFNKRPTLPVVQRADIPNPFAVTVVSKSVIASALDLQLGLYFNTSIVSCEVGDVQITTTQYAHRSLRSMLVLEVAASGIPSGKECTIKFENCSLPWENLTDFTVVENPTTDPISHTLTVKQVETPPPHSSFPTPSATVVGTAADVVPPTITFTSTMSSKLFVASYHTSLEDSLSTTPAAAAVADVQNTRRMSPDSLRVQHEQAWSEVSRGGIEIKGNITIAATINSSFYYILSAVRDDWPYGLSPGGLTRNDYQGHSFWDTETWMFPSLVALHPSLALSLTEYRKLRLLSARIRARTHSVYSFRTYCWLWRCDATMGIGFAWIRRLT